MTTDVVIIGGGIIGLSMAYRLSLEGASVTIIERGKPGREASWAGAGMLPPGNLDKSEYPEAMIRGLSDSIWPQLTQELFELTGIDNGYRNSGGLEVRYRSDESFLEDIQKWKDQEVPVEVLDQELLHQQEPALSRKLVQGYFLPTMHQVRNPRQISAIYSACVMHGVNFRTDETVTELLREGDCIRGVKTDFDSISCDHVCIAAGSWSNRLLESLGVSNSIEPVRGQIVLLRTNPTILNHVIQVGPQYIVPRPDGRILIGSTMERAGYEKSTTASGIAGLIDFAIELVPELKNACVEKTWAGLRPGSEDGLPYLGRVENFENLSIASGHFREGLQLSPATAVLMTEHILQKETTIPLEPFSLSRSRVQS